ncbi:MAG: hypothetical protein J6Q93_01245 [Prevotella sp.]|nr:hypothetical protein [Prevotella sp.]
MDYKAEVPVLTSRTGTSFINSKTVAYYSDYIPSIAAGVIPKTSQSIRARPDT